MDTRTADLIGPIEMVVARDTWRAIAGASLGPYASAMSIAWLREHRPEVHKRTARFSLVQDFITQRLTGTPALDHPNASRTLLFDVRSRGWCPELMAAVGVGEDQLAPALPSGTCVGAICEAAAAELGLRPGTAVSLGGHDQTCAGIGAGVVKAGSMLLSCGTAWVLLASVDRPSVAVGDGGVQVYCHAAPDRWALLTAHAGGNVFAWCRDVLYGGANTGYEEIGAEAAHRPLPQRVDTDDGYTSGLQLLALHRLHRIPPQLENLHAVESGVPTIFGCVGFVFRVVR